MLSVWAYTLLSVVVVSLISLIGISTLFLNEKRLRNILLFLVSFSAGALFGDAFLHLIPETSESGFLLSTSLYILLGIVVFFILEKFIHWHHHHFVGHDKEHPESYAFVNLIGDVFHNFIDGMVIAGTYLASISLGIATTLAVIFHEIPQEIGDFGVLLHGGFTKARALLYNLLAALFSVAGALVVLIIGLNVENLNLFLVPFTAGGFIYIAGSDLIPQLHKETKIENSLIQLISFLFGVFVMFLLLFLE